MKKDNFVGMEFPTHKGGVLRVIGDNGLVGNKKKYYMTCSICSKDMELFPDKFSCSKSNLLNGRIPCGCSDKPQLNQSQYEIIINRKLKDEGSGTFIGWVGGLYINAKTKVIINCEVHNSNYYVTYDSFTSKNSRCPDCGVESTKKKLRIKNPEHVISGLCDNN